MFCLKCGTELNEGAMFCPKCGCKVIADETAKPQAMDKTIKRNSDNILLIVLLLLSAGYSIFELRYWIERLYLSIRYRFVLFLPDDIKYIPIYIIALFFIFILSAIGTGTSSKKTIILGLSIGCIGLIGSLLQGICSGRYADAFEFHFFNSLRRDINILPGFLTCICFIFKLIGKRISSILLYSMSALWMFTICILPIIIGKFNYVSYDVIAIIGSLVGFVLSTFALIILAKNLDNKPNLLYFKTTNKGTSV